MKPRIDHTVLQEKTGVSFGAHTRSSGNWTTTPALWDIGQFLAPHWPQVYGYVDPQRFELLSQCPRVLDMPVKMPGSNNYRVPAALEPLTRFIKEIAEEEHQRNTLIDQYYAYLTVDHGWVEPGTTQRHAGLHADGFQGARVGAPQLTNYSYCIYDSLPTEFAIQDWDVAHLDRAVHNFFHEFDRQVKPKHLYSYPAHKIVGFGPYTVHRAAVATTRLYRRFLRVEYNVNVWDRLGNTHNPMFDYDWEMVERDTLAGLL